MSDTDRDGDIMSCSAQIFYDFMETVFELYVLKQFIGGHLEGNFKSYSVAFQYFFNTANHMCEKEQKKTCRLENMDEVPYLVFTQIM